MTTKDKTYLILYTGLLVIVALTCLGVWKLTVTYVSPTLARAWALIATLVIPVAFAVGNHWGHAESKGRLKGIDQGIEKVVKAATVATRPQRQVQIVEQPRQRLILPEPEPMIMIRSQIDDVEVL
jgi:hypothetical protein